MSNKKECQLGLLYLVHLLVSADGVVNDNEEIAVKRIMEKEGIPMSVLEEFKDKVATTKERDIYQLGIDSINRCSDQDKLKAFAHLYKMSEADGSVHVKEVRLLLYSIKSAGIEFADVVQEASRQKDS